MIYIFFFQANEPDQEVLDNCIVNSTSGIKFFELKHFSNFDKSQNDDFPLDPVPFNVILDDCQTNFLNVKFFKIDLKKLFFIE